MYTLYHHVHGIFKTDKVMMVDRKLAEGYIFFDELEAIDDIDNSEINPESEVTDRIKQEEKKELSPVEATKKRRTRKKKVEAKEG